MSLEELKRFLLKKRRSHHTDPINYRGDMTREEYTWMSSNLPEEDVYIDRSQWIMLIPTMLEKISFDPIIHVNGGVYRYEFKVMRFDSLLEFLLSITSDIRGTYLQNKEVMDLSQNVLILDLLLDSEKLTDEDRSITMKDMFETFSGKEVYKLIFPHENLTVEELVIDKKMRGLVKGA